MTTTRNTPAAQPGPITLRGNLGSTGIRVVVDPGRTVAEVVVSTPEDEGPVANAVRAATLHAAGDQISVNIAAISTVSGATGGPVQINYGSGTFISGDNFGQQVNTFADPGSVAAGIIHGGVHQTVDLDDDGQGYGPSVVANTIHGGVHQTVRRGPGARPGRAAGFTGQAARVAIGVAPIDVVAYLPPGSTIDLRTMAGGLDASSGPLNTVTFNTKAGDITVPEARGVDLDTVAGHVKVGKLGNGTIKSISGDITVDELTGRLTARGVSGDIDVTGGPAATLHAHTVSGGIRGAGGLDLDANTVAGRVRTR